MKRASARKTRLPGAGRSKERVPRHPRINALVRPISLAPSVQREELVLPRCNTEAMTLHLKEISVTVAPGAHAIVIVDQTGWHFAKALVIPDNITLLALPSKSPELNPVENIWQFIRDNWLSNRIFRSYNDIVDHCCFAWNQLVNQSWKIMSTGMREWAHQ